MKHSRTPRAREAGSPAYAAACAQWRWKIPHRYNVARDVLDRHALAGGGGREAFRHVTPTESHSLTYAGLAALSRRAANMLRGLGLRRGDRLALRLANDSAFPVLLLGAIRAGIIPVPTSPLLKAEELRFVLDDCGAAGVACSPLHREGAEEALVQSDDSFVRLWAGPEAPKGWTGLEEALMRAADSRRSDAMTLANAPAYICYTSGTTGFPKGVMHAHRALIGHEPATRHWQCLRPDDVTLHAGAFNWTYTFGAGLVDVLRQGATACVYSGPHDPETWLRLMIQQGITVFMAVPTVYRQILSRASRSPWADRLPEGLHLMSAGEALGEDIGAQWRERFGHKIYEGMGMSEFSYYLSQSPHWPSPPGSVGRPQPGHRIVIVDEELNPAAPGATGVMASPDDDPGIMLGYWNRPEETAAMFRTSPSLGPLFVTSDLARMDGEGNVWLEGRSDDVIKSFGYRISPAEVEAAIMRHPAVAETGVAGHEIAPHKTLVTAWVVLKPGQVRSEGLALSVMEEARRHLADYKAPRKIVFADSLPRTPNGKVQRKRLVGDRS